MTDLKTKIEESTEYIRTKTDLIPDIGVVLGSGLGSLAKDVQEAVSIPFAEIPHFPPSTVKGHAGNLVLGYMEGKKVAFLQGRIHFYEGYTMEQVTYPVRLLKALGIKVFVVTNASGGLNGSFVPGDLMLIIDHLNLMGFNPLLGPHEDWMGERFLNMSMAYDPQLLKLSLDVAKREEIEVKLGVYAAFTGPTFETLAEVKYLKTIGADAVGMSTVPEVIVARQAGLKVLGVSCITNVHSNDDYQDMLNGKVIPPSTHEEVLKVAAKAKEKFIRLIRAIIREIET